MYNYGLYLLDVFWIKIMQQMEFFMVERTIHATSSDI